ncbi:hypothetical protein [Xanthomonas sp. XNM01]|uniref:hypothetical protein n=1 Tax=Xanthomonas sp. XNM01 TaxID=2769289 RepID=UPI0017852E08|nr:hypothetical protein [Xanthomonas sp. XNM01]MBD9369565.1 hypothetical protein [Xanthomonas sp. XNM01]
MIDAIAPRYAPPPGRPSFGPLDYILCVALVMLATAAAYHPYFFGDEISPLRDTSKADGFIDALLLISQYKPRLVFNAIWAWGGESGWSRSGFAFVNGAAIAWICSVSAWMAGRYGSATRVQAWLLVGCIVASRFSAMLYFDYVSGIIETLSLALLLSTAALALLAVRSGSTAAWCGCVLLATFAVLVHERYMAGTTALACALFAFVSIFSRDRLTWRSCIGLALLAVVPPAVFLGLIEAMGSLPASTGTSGTAVRLDAGTLAVFARYVANVFFGLNFGDEWFVGSLHMGSTWGFRLAAVYGVAFLFAWGWFAATVRRDRLATLRVLGMLTVIGGLLVMASLPGADRQEARWIYPVGVLIALMVFASSSAKVRMVLLSLTLSLSSIHWASGALSSTANVYESRTARNLASGVNNAVPAGRDAVLMGMGEGLAAVWSVGEYAGVAEFARRNFRVPLSLRIHERGASLDGVDMGLMRSGTDADGAALFSPVYGRDLQMLLDPALIDSERRRAPEERILGGAGRWDGWSWSEAPDDPDAPLNLPAQGNVVGFLEVPAAALDTHELVYRARLEAPSHPSQMRLQINWMAAGGGFIEASIVVVDVGAEWQDFTLRAHRPAGAEAGLVYANLHEVQGGGVVLESVALRRDTVRTLGAGLAWDGWTWTRAPEIGSNGVRLLDPTVFAGYREQPAAQLDNRLLVYRAHALEAGGAKMRLQINWHDARGRFISAIIQVVDVGAASANYPLLVVAPANAATGLVYANLHDGERQDVVLESVELLERN